MRSDRARRLKRGGDKNFVQLDAEDAEKRYLLEPVDFLTEIDEEIHVLCEALIATEGRLGPMKTEDRRTCSICGIEFSGAIEFCPLCMLTGKTPFRGTPSRL